MCDFCAGLTFKKIPGGNLYMWKDHLYLCGEAANMDTARAVDLGPVDFCIVCGQAVQAERVPRCEHCGTPYKVVEDATTDIYYTPVKLSAEIKRGKYATFDETGEMCVIPVRSVVPNCNCGYHVTPDVKNGENIS